MIRSLLVLALVLGAGEAGALRLGKAGIQAGPSEVYVSRTITLTVELEDDGRDGSNLIHTEVKPDPEGAARLLAAEAPPSFGCTGTGTVAGRWVYRALAPGPVKFKVSSSILTCTLVVESTLEEESKPVEIRVAPVWSEAAIVPPVTAPQERFEVRVSLRNDADKTVWFIRPGAHEDVRMTGRMITLPQGEMTVSPAGRFRDGELELPPGEVVTVAWPFMSTDVGEARFRIIAAGLLIASPPATVRGRGEMWIGFPGITADVYSIREPAAAEEEFHLDAEIWNVGDYVGLDGVEVGLSVSPPDAAGLITPAWSTTLVCPPNTMALARFKMRMLKPGPVEITLTGSGRETDTGKTVIATPGVARMKVLPPPDVKLKLEVAAATVLVGSEVGFALSAANRSPAGTRDMAPFLVARRGRIAARAMEPLFQSVPAGESALFRGSFVPAEAGVTEVLGQVTMRGDRGGERRTVKSDSVSVLAVAPPRFTLASRRTRCYSGGRETLEFDLVNAGSERVRVTEVTAYLAGEGPDGLALERPKPGAFDLDPGKSAAVEVAAEVPAAAEPYWISAMVQVSGRTATALLPFEVRLPARPLALACPPRPGLTVVEPAPVFRPPLDPLMQVEWTLTAAGQVGVAVLDEKGGVAVTLLKPERRPAGWHSLLWTGEDAAGRLLPEGRYVLRVAGPASGTVPVEPGGAAGWPASAAWRSDRPLAIGRK